MKNQKLGYLRLIVILGAAIIGIACNLQMAGPNPTAQGIAATAAPEGSVPDPSSQAPDLLPSPTWTQELTRILTATFTPSLTPTFTITLVTMTAGQNLSCVKGPDWILYEWVASIAKGELVTLTARATPDYKDYYYVRKSDGTECWAFGGSSILDGDPTALPLRDAPPLPTVTYVIQNQVYIPLCDVFIRGANESGWGADRLTAPSIAINNSFGIYITAGYYDVLIKDCNGTVLYEGDDRPIGSEPGSRTQVIANDVRFKIYNALVFSVCKIEIQPEGSTWKILFNSATDGGPFAVGAQKYFTLRTGNYQMRVTRCPNVVYFTSPLYVHPGMADLGWA
jgi:hypothetical protein